MTNPEDGDATPAYVNQDGPAQHSHMLDDPAFPVPGDAIDHVDADPPLRTKHQEYADALRQIADFYEAHPELKLPYDRDMNNYSSDSKEEAAAILRALGKVNKEFNEYHLILWKQFGPLRLRFVFTREGICERKVVGVETIPARFVEAHTEPARTKEIVEWKCGSILDSVGEDRGD